MTIDVMSNLEAWWQKTRRPMLRKELLTLVAAERELQDERWGIQSHHDDTWRDILDEEVQEVLEYLGIDRGNVDRSTDMAKELIQVAAVALAWAEDLAIGYALAGEDNAEQPAAGSSTALRG